MQNMLLKIHSLQIADVQSYFQRFILLPDTSRISSISNKAGDVDHLVDNDEQIEQLPDIKRLKLHDVNRA